MGIGTSLSLGIFLAQQAPIFYVSGLLIARMGANSSDILNVFLQVGAVLNTLSGVVGLWPLVMEATTLTVPILEIIELDTDSEEGVGKVQSTTGLQAGGKVDVNGRETVVEELKSVSISSSSSSMMLDTVVVNPEDVKGGVEFKDVDFVYPTRPENQILSKFSLNVAPGQVVAFVGSSGCGKSSILQVLLGLYPVQGKDFVFLFEWLLYL
jgi:ABC-type multidrug transport system fused ATPase/permease subunit